MLQPAQILRPRERGFRSLRITRNAAAVPASLLLRVIFFQPAFILDDSGGDKLHASIMKHRLRLLWKQANEFFGFVYELVAR